MRSNDVLKEIAKMLRLYHDAVSDFPLLADWKPMDHTPNYIEVLCYNDFAIYNIIFNNKKPVGIIDFDVAAPGPRLWDINMPPPYLRRVCTESKPFVEAHRDHY